MIADKKEVLDYLRNQQKAAEIESKINGVNVWVLLGAIGVVAWQLTTTPGAKLWSDYELLTRTLVLAVALYMLFPLIDTSGREQEELRYSRSVFSEIEAPFLWLFKGILLFLPPVALWQLAGRSVGTVILSVFGLAFIILSLIAILKPFLPQKQTDARFPKPEFGLTRRGDMAGTIVLGILFVVALVEQVVYFLSVQGGVSMSEAKPIMLLAVLYLMVLITVSRKQKNDRIAWTYELETDIVLGAISPEVAIRRIENRRLGHRLQDVVNRFFDDLDERFIEVDSRLEECAKKINDAKEVPEEYPAERKARVAAASEGLKGQIDALEADCKEFHDYLGKLEKTSSGRKAALVPVLASLKLRHRMYHERGNSIKLRLDRLIR